MIKLKGVTEGEIDQSIKQDSENEDDEFKRIESEEQLRKYIRSTNPLVEPGY